MIDDQVYARTRRLFLGEHWKIGTITAQLGVHPEAVRRVIDADAFNSKRPGSTQASLAAPYRDFIKEQLDLYPTLCATRVQGMIKGRGYKGGYAPVRRLVKVLRPAGAGTPGSPGRSLRALHDSRPDAAGPGLPGQHPRAGTPLALLFYAHPRLLCIDEIGYLRFDSRNADLLCQVICRRYEVKSVVLTIDLAFSDRPTIFPSATSATELIDRLIHHALILPIEGESYRRRDAELAAKSHRAASAGANKTTD